MRRIIRSQVFINISSTLLLVFVWLPLVGAIIVNITKPIPLTFLQPLGIAFLVSANVFFGYSRALKESDEIYEKTLNLGRILLLSALLIGFSMIATYIMSSSTANPQEDPIFTILFVPALLILSKAALASSSLIVISPIIEYIMYLAYSIDLRLPSRDE